MKTTHLSFFAISIFFLFNSIALCLDSAADKHALLSFKSSITSDPHAILTTNWSENTSVCDWIGVTCGVNHQRVTALNLSGFDLAGTVAPHLRNLTFLRYLDISSNSFTGFLPIELSKLRRLKVMNLRANSFAGEIPTWLGSLPQLEELDLHNNSFTGRIPPSLFNNSNLQRLDLSYNHLSGNIPTEIGSGGSTLKELRILNNHLSGVIPEEIRNLSSLQVLNLNSNELSGSIPHAIFNISSLTEIRIHNNSLSGPLPSHLCDNLPNIKQLSISYNQLSGEIPQNIWKCRHLEILSLSYNHFNGEIPLEIGSLNTLRELYLGYNNFRGFAPAEIGNLSRLEILNIDSASLSGNIPSSVFNISSLMELSFSENSLSGGIPSFNNNLRQLEQLYLDNNKLTALGNVKGLTSLDLSYNDLSSSIPKSLESLPYLKLFNVSNNKLEGEIPDGGPFGHFTPQSFSHNFALCGSPRFHVQPCPQTHHRSNLKKFLVASVILAVMFVIIIFGFVRRCKQEQVEVSSHVSPITEWRRISHVELERGTKCFSDTNLLGRGSFGSVYQCTLTDGLEVAVKVFDLHLQGAARSFDTEIEILSSIRHRNLVQLIGCCSNVEFRALILAYMPNGSLDNWLHSNMYSDLDLIQRLKIAIDVAAALEYLHHGYSFPIVHCDVKPSNVLLDRDMTAHLSDFGISKLFEGGEAFIQTQTLATIGYAAPELGVEGKVSTHGDVYSFGIMLLEMFTGKKPTDDMFGGETSLRELVTEALQQNAATEIMAVALLSTEDRDFSATERCISSIFELAMKCLEISADERINMIEAAATLHKIKATVEAALGRRRQRYALSISTGENGT